MATEVVSSNESNITDGFADSADPIAKLGTFVLLDDLEAINNWTDYTMTVLVKSGLGQTLGVMVRVVDDSDYYRLAWQNGEYLRLERARPGEVFQVLADSHNISKEWTYFPVNGSWFEISVTCVGRQLDVVIQGRHPWPTIYDDSGDALTHGSVAVYSYGNPGVVFNDWEVYGALNALTAPLAITGQPVPSPSLSPLAPVVDIPTFIRRPVYRYAVRYPNLGLNNYTLPLDAAVQNAIQDTIGFNETWLIGKRVGSVIAEYASTFSDSDSAQRKSPSAGAVGQSLTSYICKGSFTMDTGLVASCKNGVISVNITNVSTGTSTNGATHDGVIIGVIIAVVVVTLVTIGVIGFFVEKRRRRARLGKGKAQDGDQSLEEVVNARIRSKIGPDVYDKLDKAGMLDNVLTMPVNAGENLNAFSLKSMTKEHLLVTMLESAKPRYGHWEVLVLDKHCLRTTSAVCRLSDLISRGVTLVQPLEELHESNCPSSRLNTVFFLKPTEDSFWYLERVCAHGSPKYATAAGGAGKSNVRRNEMHVFTSSRVSDSMLKVLRDRPQLLQCMSTFKELNIDYLALDERVFSLDRILSLTKIYGKQETRRQFGELNKSEAFTEECREIGRQLATVFGVLKALRPSIEIHTTSVAQDATMEIAQAVKNALEHLQNDLGVDADSIAMRRPAKLLIVDRAADPITPLQHDDTYQAFVHDTLRGPDKSTSNHSDDRHPVSHGWDDEFFVHRLPDTEDPTWRALRHVPIHDAIMHVHAELHTFLTSNAAARMHRNASLNVGVSQQATESQQLPSIRELAEAARAAPEYRETVERLSLHLELLEKCAALYESRSLSTVIELERTLVSGVQASNGKRVKSSDQRRVLENVLCDTTVDAQSKLRLILLWMACRGADADSLVRWLSIAEVNEDGRCAVRAFKESLQADRHGADSARRQRRNRNGAPLLRSIMERACDLQSASDTTTSSKSSKSADDIEEEEEQVHSITPRTPLSLRRRLRSPISFLRGRSRNIEAAPKTMNKPTSATDPMLVVIFVVGGISNTEARLAHEISKLTPDAEIILGGTDILTPREFLKELSFIYKEDETKSA